MTGQPDFATFTISYVPGPRIVQLKSLKLYLYDFRHEGVFMKKYQPDTRDLVKSVEPRRLHGGLCLERPG